MKTNRYEVREQTVTCPITGKKNPGWGIYDTKENKFTKNWLALGLRSLADKDCKSMNWYDRRKIGESEQ